METAKMQSNLDANFSNVHIAHTHTHPPTVDPIDHFRDAFMFAFVMTTKTCCMAFDAILQFSMYALCDWQRKTPPHRLN